MIRHIPRIALLIGALAVAGQASAHGGGRGYYGPGPLLGAAVVGAVVGAAVSSGHRTVYVEQPVYVPQPVYVAPPPVYYEPYPVVIERYRGPPPPRYYRERYYGPPPVYYGPPRW